MESKVPDYYKEQIHWLDEIDRGTYEEELKNVFGEDYKKVIDFFKDGLIFNTEEFDKDYSFEVSYNHLKNDKNFRSAYTRHTDELNYLECKLISIDWEDRYLSFAIDKEKLHKIINIKKSK